MFHVFFLYTPVTIIYNSSILLYLNYIYELHVCILSIKKDKQHANETKKAT